MKNINTKALVNAALMTAVTAVLIMLSMWVPGLSVLATLVSGVPIAVVTVKHGLKTSVTAAAALLLVLCIATGEPINVCVLFFMMVIPGIVSGICIKSDRGFFISLVLVILSVIMAFMLNIQIINIMYGDNFVMDFITEYANTFGEVLKQRMNALMSIEGGAESLEGVDVEVITKQTATGMINMLTLYLPSLVIISSAVIGYFILKINAFFLKRLRIKEYRSNVPFRYLTVPKSLVYIMFLVDLIVMLSNMQDGSLVTSALMNMQSILTFIVIICGLAFIEFYFSRAVQQGWVRGIVYVAAFIFGGAFISILVYVIELLGIIDILFGFRRYLFNSNMKS